MLNHSCTLATRFWPLHFSRGTCYTTRYCVSFLVHCSSLHLANSRYSIQVSHYGWNNCTHIKYIVLFLFSLTFKVSFCHSFLHVLRSYQGSYLWIYFVLSYYLHGCYLISGHLVFAVKTTMSETNVSVG